MDAPAVWPITLNPIKKGAMAVIQQMLSEEAAMTVRDEALTHQRDRPRFDARTHADWKWIAPAMVARVRLTADGNSQPRSGVNP